VLAHSKVNEVVGAGSPRGRKSMDTLSAYAMALANIRNELMVFDWDKAAELIRDSK
jgi:hypothetical protein